MDTKWSPQMSISIVCKLVKMRKMFISKKRHKNLKIFEMKIKKGEST